MIKKVTFSVFPIILFVSLYNFNVVNSKTSGSPAGGYTGSTSHGRTCGTNGGCHGGGATSEIGWITSDVPSSGYVAGATYTISASASHSTFNKFGFELMAEDAFGNSTGTLAATTFTQLINSSTSITHSTSSTAGSNNTKTWNFPWTAPNFGTGDVTFYAAFNCANGSGVGGDDIRTSTLTISENPVGISSIPHGNGFKVFPNPATSFVEIQPEKEALFSIYNSTGKLVEQINIEKNTRIDLNNYSAGTYVVIEDVRGSKTVSKFIKR